MEFKVQGLGFKDLAVQGDFRQSDSVQSRRGAQQKQALSSSQGVWGFGFQVLGSVNPTLSYQNLLVCGFLL